MQSLFSPLFLEKLQQLVIQHHGVYPVLPPQGIFFESLACRAFVLSGWPEKQVVATAPNQPQHDLTVGTKKISLKTETGKVTKKSKISITKLCTTETGDWTSEALIRHTFNHLSRYDHILMLRSIWAPRKFLYQCIEIPLDLLRRIEGSAVAASGKRQGRQSLSATVMDQGEAIYQIRFDGADGKCQIKNLLLSRCRLLSEWEYDLPIRTS